MTGPTARVEQPSSEGEMALLALGTILLRRRRIMLILGALGLLIGVASALLSHRKYASTATFIPQGSDNSANSALALAASQFGVRMPTTGAGWGPPIYVELLQSRALLEPLSRDTVTVAEENRRHVPLLDLLEIDGPDSPLRTDRAVRALQRIVSATEVKALGAVRLTVTTPWPSVSLALADRLVRGVNDFNLTSRKSQASSERQFVELQATDAEHNLRQAEDRLEAFMQGNRGLGGSPALALQRDRLQRDVTLRQQVYTTLMQSLEEARIREVRDTPVLTVLETPRLAAVPEPRKLAVKGVLGGFLGVVVGVLLAFLMDGFARARVATSSEARAFFALVEEATPRLLRRG